MPISFSLRAILNFKKIPTFLRDGSFNVQELLKLKCFALCIKLNAMKPHLYIPHYKSCGLTNLPLFENISLCFSWWSKYLDSIDSTTWNIQRHVIYKVWTKAYYMYNYGIGNQICIVSIHVHTFYTHVGQFRPNNFNSLLAYLFFFEK